MGYTAGEVAKKLGLSKDALRYYEKEGILPPIQRNQSGHRTYSESDVEWIFHVRCLRDTDMPIHRIKRYVGLLTEGGASIPERRKILADHKLLMEEKTKTYQNFLQLIERKLAFYDEALASDHPQEARCMDYVAEWEHFRFALGGIRHD